MNHQILKHQKKLTPHLLTDPGAGAPPLPPQGLLRDVQLPGPKALEGQEPAPLGCLWGKSWEKWPKFMVKIWKTWENHGKNGKNPWDMTQESWVVFS